MEKQSEFKVLQLAPQDIDKAAEQTGHSNPDIRGDWMKRSEAGEIVMFAIKDGDDYIASVNLLLYGADEKEVVDEIGKIPTINGLGTNEDYRRKGIGSKLMDACENYVVGHKDLPQSVALLVETDNDNAKQIYEARGYKYHKVDGQNTIVSSWPEIDENGNKQMYHATCYLMVKDL